MFCHGALRKPKGWRRLVKVDQDVPVARKVTNFAWPLGQRGGSRENLTRLEFCDVSPDALTMIIFILEQFRAAN